MLADNAAQRYQSQTRQIMQRHSATQSAAVSQRMGKRNPRYPTRIEDYEVGAIIGRGGFAVVHQAVSKHKDSYGAEVAIKMIDKAVMTRSNLSSRVQTELQIHSNLSHPSILQLHTYFESASHVYLVTELCPHGELYRYIQGRTNGHLTEAEARGALEEIVKGVLYLHSLGIIHRDLKLSNVLLTRDYHLKIADFGLAVKLNTPEGEQKTMCGTPNYISPEIVSRLPYGLSSDLWSLGCLMVTILTGKPPFDSQAVKSTLDKVARVEYYLPDSISHDARDLIGKLLMKDPKKRLTLRDILNHRWFSYPRLPLKSNAPRQDTLDEASDGQTTKEERTFAARENQPQITFANSTSQPEKFSSFGDEHIDTPLFSSVSTQKTNKSPRMTSTPICNAGMHSFSTLRLKAMQQKTKHGLISIQANGNVLLDFEREKHLIVISGESSLIQLCDRNTNMPVQSYSMKAPVPSALLKIHSYAAKFIQLVASKTPKIIFYSPQAKCFLMENREFEMMFYNGIKAAYRPGLLDNGKVTFRLPTGFSSQLSSTQEFELGATAFQIPPELASCFKHVQECLKTCLDIESSSANGPFPVILKSSNIGIDGSNANSGKIHSPDPSIHPSTLSSAPSAKNRGPASFSHSEQLPEMTRVKSRSSITTGTASTLYIPDSNLLENSTSKRLIGNPSNHLDTYTVALPVSAATTSVLKDLSGLKPSFKKCQAYLDGVGWCSRDKNGEFVMLFNDGIHMAVDSRDQNLVWTDVRNNQNEIRYKIDKSLPTEIKTKLSHFPKFLALFRK